MSSNENKNAFASNPERNYNIITCLPNNSLERMGSRFPRLGNPKIDQFTDTKTNKFSDKIDRKPSDHTLALSKPEEVKNLMNSSSLNYDFISYTHKQNPDTIYSLRTKGGIVTNKKKSIAEFADLGRLMCPNFNPEFQETLRERPFAFRRPKGMCAYLCDTEKGYGRKQFRKFKY
jgi:hypothetical protein